MPQLKGPNVLAAGAGAVSLPCHRPTAIPQPQPQPQCAPLITSLMGYQRYGIKIQILKKDGDTWYKQRWADNMRRHWSLSFVSHRFRFLYTPYSPFDQIVQFVCSQWIPLPNCWIGADCLFFASNHSHWSPFVIGWMGNFEPVGSFFDHSFDLFSSLSQRCARKYPVPYPCTHTQTHSCTHRCQFLCGPFWWVAHKQLSFFKSYYCRFWS